MKTKTSELEGAALDWAVSQTMPEYMEGFDVHKKLGIIGEHWAPPFSTDWSHGGPLIDKHEITIHSPTSSHYPDDGICAAEVTKPHRGRDWITHYAEGATMLVAAMRAIVASEIGDEVDVPEELL